MNNAAATTQAQNTEMFSALKSLTAELNAVGYKPVLTDKVKNLRIGGRQLLGIDSEPVVVIPHLGIEIYATAAGTVVLGYYGRKTKREFYSRYMTAERTEKAMIEWITSRNARYVEGLEETKRQKENIINVKAGDVFVSSWGYSMTIVTWYQITAIKGCAVEVRELRTETNGDGWSGKTVPMIGQFADKEARKMRICKNGSLKFSSSERAYKVEPNRIVCGVPVYDGRYYNHAD